MNKKIVIVLVILIVVLIVMTIWLVLKLNNSNSQKISSEASDFSYVTLTNGETYFGKLSFFPSPRLTSVFFLQKIVDAKNNPQISLQAFKDTLWGPIDELNLNSKEIVSWAKLRSDSQVVQTITSQLSQSKATVPPASQSKEETPAPQSE